MRRGVRPRFVRSWPKSVLGWQVYICISSLTQTRCCRKFRCKYFTKREFYYLSSSRRRVSVCEIISAYGFELWFRKNMYVSTSLAGLISFLSCCWVLKHTVRFGLEDVAELVVWNFWQNMIYTTAKEIIALCDASDSAVLQNFAFSCLRKRTLITRCIANFDRAAESWF